MKQLCDTHFAQLIPSAPPNWEQIVMGTLIMIFMVVIKKEPNFAEYNFQERKKD